MRRAAQRLARATSRSQTDASSSFRNIFAGMSLGVCIGAVGSLLALTTTEDELPVPRERPATKQGGTSEQHEALRYGAPSNSNVSVRSGYVVAFDYRTRNASWVLEHLTKGSLQVMDDTDRSKSNFTVDVATPEPFRVHPNQYAKSGYDKGHLAPARDMTSSQQALNESFIMSNISPQVGVGFNRSYWSRVEGFVRHLAHHFDGVYVVTGPLFLPKKHKKSGEYRVSYPVIGTPPDAIAVPTHFFKVLLARQRDGSFVTAGFILPNQPISEKKPLLDFLTPLHVIEKYSGLLFFDKLEHVEKLDLCTTTKCSLAGAYKRAVSDSS